VKIAPVKIAIMPNYKAHSIWSCNMRVVYRKLDIIVYLNNVVS